MGNRINIIGALAAACLWLVSNQPSQAQGAPSSLMDLSAKEAAAGLTQLTLSFSPNTPDYRVVGNDTQHITIHLLNTGGGTASSPQGTQLVRSAIVQPSGLDLDIIVETTANARVTVRKTSATTLVADIRDSRASTTTAVAMADGGPQPGPGLPVVMDPPPGQDGYVLIPLKYADISEVVGLLSEGVTVKSNDSFTPQEPGFGSQGMNNGTPAPNTQPSIDDKPLGQAVDSSIAVDRRLNAIWVKGSPEHIARVKAQIAVIDQPVVSIMLDTEIVELTEAGAKSLGIDFTNSNGGLAVGTYQTGQYVTASYGSGVSHLASGALQAALYAQVQKGEGKIISNPRISAQSGSSAKIITGDALPILTAITLSGVNGVSQQVQYVNVGVTLQIAPRVSADGDVTSHVFCVVSSVTGYSQGYPTISQRNAETSATVHDGESFVIGGLRQDQTMTSVSKIPLLGDIPLVGGAFTIDKRSRSKTDLYIVVTPHIITRKSSAPASQ